jgi:hypothetical protein
LLPKFFISPLYICVAWASVWIDSTLRASKAMPSGQAQMSPLILPLASARSLAFAGEHELVHHRVAGARPADGKRCVGGEAARVTAWPHHAPLAFCYRHLDHRHAVGSLRLLHLLGAPVALAAITDATQPAGTTNQSVASA